MSLATASRMSLATACRMILATASRMSLATSRMSLATASRMSSAPTVRVPGGWRFQVEDLPSAVELTVEIGQQIATTDIQTDVLPGAVRLLIAGRLLQLHLPAEVRPDGATARRSKATGRLLLCMPKCRDCGTGCTALGGTAGKRGAKPAAKVLASALPCCTEESAGSAGPPPLPL
jgi:hypothetical protein